MRKLQIAGFGLGVLAFLASLVCSRTQLGDDLWRAGVAFMLGDGVLILLWPTLPAKPRAAMPERDG